jgi:SAM-dependent methyltransferase
VSETSAMEAEFDTVASWTEDAVAELGADHAIPAACRGSGSPAQLEWLAGGLELDAARRFLDAGSGLGGPAAWLREHTGPAWRGQAVLAEPMPHAAAASQRLFDLPAVVAWAERLPLRDHAFDAAWSVGVLCTTRSQRLMLDELHRVLVPGGRLSLMVLVRTVDELPEAPEGNHFPSPDELHHVLDTAGFRADDEVDAATLPDAGDEWHAAERRVDEVLRRDHGEHPDFRRAEEQGEVMGRLMGAGLISMRLLRTTALPRTRPPRRRGEDGHVPRRRAVAPDE